MSLIRTRIEWTKGPNGELGYTWNPIVGCDGPNGVPCPYCYGKTFASRRMGEYGRQPKGEEFKPRFLPERLEDPLKLKKPGRIFAGSMTDLFGEQVDPEWVRRVWDVMWQANHHTFVVLTKRADRMRDWVRENASMRHFGWGKVEECAPMQPGDLMPMDSLYHRQRCGWANEAEPYRCDHPDQEYKTQEEENCVDHSCPIAYAAYREDIQEKDPDLYASDYESYPDAEPKDWVVLHSRPRYAYAHNVWLGTSITNQADANERIPWLLKTPAAVRLVSLEPMQAPVWLALYLPNPPGKFMLTLGGTEYINRLDWVIVGSETGNRAGKVVPKREWIEQIVSQCKAARVPLFVKRSIERLYPGDWPREYPEGK